MGKTSLTVITTHLNADFDAMASALAASKLYPGAVIVLPGSQEKGLRDFLLKSSMINREKIQLNMVRLKDIDLDRIRRIIIVDTKQKDRIGALAKVIERPDVEVFIYDHHPPSDMDIQKGEFFFQPVGANTTMMVKHLREKGIELSPHEATFLAIGIYEDTGSFTFPSTTPEDLMAVAWLMENGADLKAVNEILTYHLTPEQVDILRDLLHSASIHYISGIPIVIAKTTLVDYMEDFAVLAHQLIDMNTMRVLFAMALMAGQVIIVGRSREKRVDVGKILKTLGGGGHPMAASASLRGVTLQEAEEKLLSSIIYKLGTEPKVKDIMSYPVLSTTPEIPIEEAHDQLTRFGITVLPIVEKEKVLGTISRRTIEKALHLKLGKLPVKEYMSTDFEIVAPEDTFSRVQELIVGRRQRFLPVVEKEKIVGVITRTDLLQILTGDKVRHPDPLLEEPLQKRNISALIREKLKGRILDILTSAGDVGEKIGCHVYAVGGFVRDLILRVPNLDIDLVIEGDGIAFAHEFAKRFGARVRAHEKFKTAVVIFPDGFKVDVATARWEYYEYPAAMPTVALSSIKLDLYRRDFTINTLALKLNPREFGTIIDFFGGQRDIKDGVIRVLHSLSFVEDPTRVFRAIRFEQRYGFKIGKHTLRLIKNALALNLFSKISGKRLSTELKLMLSESDPRPALQRCADLDILNVIHPSIHLTPSIKEALSMTHDVLTWYELLYKPQKPRKWIVYLLSLISDLKKREIQHLVTRLSLTGRIKKLFTEDLLFAKKAAVELERRPFMKPSEVYLLLKSIPLELLLFILSNTKIGAVKKAVSRFITELKDIKPKLGGKDLHKMGFPHGPVFSTILNRLQEACLNSEVRKREEEIALVMREFGDILKSIDEV